MPNQELHHKTLQSSLLSVVQRGGSDDEIAARKANEKAVSKTKMTMKAGGRGPQDQAQFTEL
jgi:hypothetical protein